MLGRAGQNPSINTTHSQGETWMSYRTMNFRTAGRWTFGVLLLLAVSRQAAFAQIVINEIVEDERAADSTQIPDTREFVELYNSGNSAVPIGDWTLSYYNLDDGTTFFTDTIPSGTMLAAGDYWVMGHPGVPNVDQVLATLPTELFDNTNMIFELKDNGGTLRDAVALETLTGPVDGEELIFANQAQLDQIGGPGQTAGVAGAHGGVWGQVLSSNATAPNVTQSLGRYLDGRDTNFNGRDFGFQPLTPGTSNNQPQIPAYIVPNVDALAVGTTINTTHASFVLPRVIAPGTVNAFNPNAIPVSPQGGNAIIAYDETGGGNAIYSKELVTEFKLYAYIDPTALANATADSNRSEASVYGIGTTDPFFATPNSAGLLTAPPGTGGNITSSSNGSAGLGWLIQRRTSNTAGVQTSAAVLQLIDFKDGGESVAPIDANDSRVWEIIETIDISNLAAGWHVLGIDYDPLTGAVAGSFDNQTFSFNTATGLVGNFYVGYRENLPGAGNGPARPPTYDLFVAPANDADFDADGDIDGADFLRWQRNNGISDGSADLADGDATGDGNVNAADLAIWRTQFATATPVIGAVPEPGSAMIALLGAAAALAGRKGSFRRQIT
jgi:hypothetical protein